ncbi:uncharacterized protein LOC112350986 [Selaginella moellendorffii]|uniref:uncharacterized protein LOC112350986 n=1 Tax=Selaginella moellendorffii TaxID=88036 RepID=UPI000D1C7582|nr:uncharacterized protein LOC112350986 [Selaginella moellendorffii]|eukprot:XP_024543831.1 uncharacterized protein LOC112350986 [Selaginella moellendorffii]
MGLCLSKKDVLIQKPQRDHLLSLSGIHNAAILVPDSPSISVVSTELSSLAAAERHLLKNRSSSGGAMRSSSASNMAECGSVREWRFHRNSSAGSGSVRNLLSSSSDADADDLASGASYSAAARSSGFSYLSSPMVEAMDAAFGLDSIARSYAKARERFELDGVGAGLNPRLLEIDEDEEEHEEEERHQEQEEDDDGMSEYSSTCSSLGIKKKSQARSLHVFGEVFGEPTPRINRMAAPAMPTIRIIAGERDSFSKKCDVSVFGADHYFHARNLHPSQQHAARSSVDFGPEIAGSGEQPQHNVHVRSARWGFVLDSGGSDEMEGDEELSRLSTSSVLVEPISKPSFTNSSNAAVFMAVPPRSESWHANFSFSHMNPSSAAVNPPPPLAKDQRYEDSMTSRSSTTSSSHDYSSSSRDLSSNLNSYGFPPPRAAAKKLVRDSSLSSSEEGDSSNFQRLPYDRCDLDGDDSDSSNDLFEIDNLGKDFLLYPMNSAFLQDPDISYSSAANKSTISTKGSNPQHQFQPRIVGHSSGSSILGPTQRANVLVSSHSKPRSSSGSDLNFQPPRKSVKGRRKSGSGFHGISSVENESFYAR